MKAIQLKDKFSNEVVVTILVRDKDNIQQIKDCWKFFQGYQSEDSNYDGWSFINAFPNLDLELLELESFTY